LGGEAEKIQHICREPINIDEHTFYITCSIGISFYPQDSEDVDNLLKYADTAMYKAKDEGKNNIQYYSSEMTKMALERVNIQVDLRKALKNDEFVLYYQPQIDVKSGDLKGVEALIRWNHPLKGFIMPDEFIDIAEDTGIIIEIDKWVMETAMKQTVSWYEQGFNAGVLSLNLSMRQLRSDNFVSEISNTMKALKFDPEWLELEITESQVMKKPEESIIKLQQISNMGVEIAIDDFGTGYSSLAYLKRLPVNKIKIDQSFIQGIPQDKEDLEIVKAIIALSKSLGLDIIAEGVETEEQRDILFEYGCECIQGYYYSQPIKAGEIEKKYFKLT
jgi:EAL domain-containing protein (putative c-di-GMP-specific phosphodiesterase class I)